MAISEYSVNGDYFQCGDTGEFGFPCCCCKHRVQQQDQEPCCFCGHNENAVKHYYCSLCGSVQRGTPYEDSKTIAHGTLAEIAYVCDECYQTIKEDISS